MKRLSEQTKQWQDEYLPNDEPQGDIVDRANVVVEAFHRRSLRATLGLLRQSLEQRRTRNRTCERCGRRIPKGRLKVLPHTTRCVACQKLFEQQRRRRCIWFTPTI